MITCCLAAVLAALPAQSAPLTEDLQILEAWREDLRSAQDSGAVVNSAVVGDSITTTRDTWVFWLRNHLWDRFGDAGEGSLDVHPSSSGDDSGGYVNLPVSIFPWGPSTTWSRTYNDTTPSHTVFVNGNWSTCEHAGGGWRLYFRAAEATLRYIEEPGAGQITLKLNGEIIHTLDANAPDTASATFEIPLPSLQTHFLELESTAPADQPQPVKLDMLDVRTGQPGSVLHRWGQNGRPCAWFLEKQDQTYQHLFDTVQPDMLMIQCDPTYEPDDQYEADLRALVARYQGHRPGMPIVLISHHRFRNDHGGPTAIMHSVAADDPDVAFINVFDVHAERQNLLDLGYLRDDVHLNETGGKFYAAWILRELLAWPRADLDLDGAVGQADLGILLSAYNTTIGDPFFVDLADIDRDGLVSQADLGILLANYGWTAP